MELVFLGGGIVPTFNFIVPVPIVNFYVGNLFCTDENHVHAPMNWFDKNNNHVEALVDGAPVISDMEEDEWRISVVCVVVVNNFDGVFFINTVSIKLNMKHYNNAEQILTVIVITI